MQIDYKYIYICFKYNFSYVLPETIDFNSTNLSYDDGECIKFFFKQ